MSWYGNGFHIIAPFVKEFHNTLVDYPHRGPVMQRFSVSFVVSLNKLLNQQFSCWLFETLCDCKVTHLCHIMILLQNIFFCYFVYLSFWTHTHVTKPTFSFSISFLLDFNSCCIFVFVWSFMFSHCPACRTSLIATRFWVVVICPIIKCLTVLEFSFILFDLCLFITTFNFILNYVPIVTFWIFTYHKIWILLIIFCFIWN